MEHISGYKEACEVLTKHLTSRAKTLAVYESYVEGTQYKGLPDWFSEKKPLWERAPCIVYPIVKMAIDSNGDLLLGEGRFPVVTVDGLEGEEADNVEKTVAEIMQQARLRAAAWEVFSAGQGCGSACAIFGLRGGRLFIDTVFARWCEPELLLDGSVASLEIRYPYLTTVLVHGEQRVVCKIYRRTIDAKRDVTYLPVTAPEDGTEPKGWQEDPARTVSHGLGYCPVVWYPHLKGCAVVNDFDGHAIHKHLTDEIRAHDFALSQRHRAALYCGDPQWTEIGVASGYNPTGNGGRKVEMPASISGGFNEAPHASYVSGSLGTKVRKKSPGTVWQYEGDAQKIKVQLHTLPGDALKVLDDHARDLRNKLSEALGVVFIDLEALPNESRISGRALESAKARQLARVDNYRADFGDRFLLPALGMLIRIALDTQLPIKGLDAIRAAVAKKPQWSWHFPSFQFVWGDYFKPSGEEEELLIRGACEAKEKGIATTRACVEKLRSIFGVKDVDSYMRELETEQAEAEKKAQEMLKAEASAKAAAKPAPAKKP